MSPFRPFVKRQPQRRRTGTASGFSLVEMLLAASILIILSLILAGMLNTILQVWMRGQGQLQYRWRARSMLNVMGAELQNATLSVDSSRGCLQFVINPEAAAEFAYHDSIFWQAPIATDTRGGNMAEVGYFVRWVDSQPVLCRFFLNPSDANYRIYSNPSNWITGPLLNQVAPATKLSFFQGLFLDNVLGFWVRAFTPDGSAYAGDSRRTTPINQLPAVLECAVVVYNGTGSRLEPFAGQLKLLAGQSETGDTFMNAVPDTLKKDTSIVSMKIFLKNSPRP